MLFFVNANLLNYFYHLNTYEKMGEERKVFSAVFPPNLSLNDGTSGKLQVWNYKN